MLVVYLISKLFIKEAPPAGPVGRGDAADRDPGRTAQAAPPEIESSPDPDARPAGYGGPSSSGRIVAGARVAAEDPDHRRHRAESVERGLRRGVGQVRVEVHPEHVLPGALAARPRFELAACSGRAPANTPQHRQQRAGLVPDGDDQRRPMRRRRSRRGVGRSIGAGDRRARPAEHQEPGPVAGQVADLVGQDLQAEQARRPRRQDGGRAPLPPVDDGLAGAGRVVGREQLPRPRPQERLRLAERLDVRVDPLDVLETLAGQRREAEPDRDDDLAADLQVVLQQQVVVLADGAVDDVLDRDDAGPRPPPTPRPRRRAEADGCPTRSGVRRRPPGRRPRRRPPARRRRRSAAWLVTVASLAAGRRPAAGRAGLPLEPGRWCRGRLVLVEVGPAACPCPAARPVRHRRPGVASAAASGRAGPVRLGEHRVEGRDVGLDARPR